MSTRLPVSRISRKGQVTIPKGVRDKLGLKPGDYVVFIVCDGKVWISRIDDATLTSLSKT